MPTGIAMENLDASGVQDAVCSATAARATKAFRPTSSLQSSSAKCFGAKELEELRQRQAGLKLDSVHSHDAALTIDTSAQITSSQAHQLRLADDSLSIVANQVGLWYCL
jgi:hypothetical protein